MNYSDREVEVFNAMINDYKKIDCDSELEKRGLEYKDYEYMGLDLDRLRYDKECCTNERVAKYLGSFGMTITKDRDEFRVQL